MKSINPDLHWYVCTFRPRKAGKAELAIHEAGVDVYLPKKRVDVWSRRVGVRIEYDVPLIPPYLFVGFKPGCINFQAVDDLVHVGSFIRNAERQPLKIPSGELEAIFLAEVAGEYDETDRARKARKEEAETLFPPGAAVKLLDDLRGLLAGFEGTVIESKRDRRYVETTGGLRSWIDVDKLDDAA
jgi:transcription antitermination factor NusG